MTKRFRKHDGDKTAERIRSILASGGWHPHEPLVFAVGRSIHPGVACQHFLDMLDKKKGGYNPSLDYNARIHYARARLVKNLLDQMVRSAQVLRKGHNSDCFYWLIPSGGKARMHNTRYMDLPLEKVKIHPDIQMRTASEINDQIPRDYAEVLHAGGTLPPVMIFLEEEENYWLADGHYRLKAHQIARRETIPACVSDGTLRDAILYACGANQQHGQVRSVDAAQKAVLRLLDDPEWSKESNIWIARACGVVEGLVKTLQQKTHDKAKMTSAARPAKGGRPKATEKAQEAADENLYGKGKHTSSKTGTSAERRIARLKRDHPDIGERLDRGEFKSVAAAERAARGEEPNQPRKKKTPLEQAKAICGKLSSAERAELLAWLQEGA